jgi:guanylate kinase
VCRELLKENGKEFSVSMTTRDPREGEIHGKDYYFVTREEFESMRDAGKLLEYAEYVGNYYGTPAEPIQKALDEGTDILLDIEPQGALQVKARRPDAVLLFLAPPSMEELARRLRGRGDTAEELVLKRLKQATWEFTQAEHYDYIVVNDLVEHAAEEVLAILTAEKCRTNERIQILKEEQ